MRPDRIIFREVRDGAAALDLVKAWNAAHPGGVGTIHPNDTAAGLMHNNAGQDGDYGSYVQTSTAVAGSNGCGADDPTRRDE